MCVEWTQTPNLTLVCWTSSGRLDFADIYCCFIVTFMLLLDFLTFVGVDKQDCINCSICARYICMYVCTHIYIILLLTPLRCYGVHIHICMFVCLYVFEITSTSAATAFDSGELFAPFQANLLFVDATCVPWIEQPAGWRLEFFHVAPQMLRVPMYKAIIISLSDFCPTFASPMCGARFWELGGESLFGESARNISIKVIDSQITLTGGWMK